MPCRLVNPTLKPSYHHITPFATTTTTTQATVQAVDTMQFNGPTYRCPATITELPFNDRIVEHQLRVWDISRWRGATDLARFFLAAGYRHLSPSMPSMCNLQEQYDGGYSSHVGLYITFTNPYDVLYLLGQAFWYGCEYIAFTTYNVFTNFHNVFPTGNGMHALPYVLPEDDE
jgi:hypothetical protein